jgi:DNA polymerase-1
MFFDAKGPTFRHEMYKDYKANRPPMPEDMVVQLPYIKKITAAFNLPIIEMSGFEADDLIGTSSPGTRILCSWSPTKPLFGTP